MGRTQEMGKDRSESALSGKRIRGERKGCQKCRGEGALHRNKVVARIFFTRGCTVFHEVKLLMSGACIFHCIGFVLSRIKGHSFIL